MKSGRLIAMRDLSGIRKRRMTVDNEINDSVENWI